VVGDLCGRLARTGRPGAKTVAAIADPPLHHPAPARLDSLGLPDWALRMVRANCAVDHRNVLAREELPLLLEARRLVGTGAVIGVGDALFSHHLLTYWGGQMLLSVDPWAGDAGDADDLGGLVGDVSHGVARERLAIFSNRSEIWRESPLDAARRVPDGSLDFVFLGSSPTGDSVADVLRAWVPKLRPGGLVAGSDYADGLTADGSPGSRRVVDKFFASCGVPVAATTLDSQPTAWLVEAPQRGWRGLEVDTQLVRPLTEVGSAG
jgi:Methyltransferase domain